MNHYHITQIGNGFWDIGTGFVRAYLLTGTRAAALIDTGLGDYPVDAAVRSVTSLPLYVLNTHGHEDHAGGNRFFDKVYMHPLDHPVYLEGGGSPAVALLSMKEGDIFDLGGLTLRVIETPGHSPGSVSVLDETNRRLFTGDLADPRMNVLPPAGGGWHISEYGASVRKAYDLRRDYDGIYPGHGAFPLGAELLRDISLGAAGIASGAGPGRPYVFEPAPDVPPLNGILYEHGAGRILKIDAIPKL